MINNNNNVRLSSSQLACQPLGRRADAYWPATSPTYWVEKRP